MRIGRQRDRVTALDDAPGIGYPTVAPDQPVFVVATPDVPIARSHGVYTLAADELGKYGVVVPTRGAHPHQISVGPAQGAALAVRDQRVFPQRRGREIAYLAHRR